MKIKFFFFAIAISAFLFACNDAANPATEDTSQVETNTSDNHAEATMLPAFQLQDAAGNVVSLQNFKGKKVFVNLWASWCPPCKREMPSIEKLSREVDTSKVVFVLLSLDDQFDKAKKYVASKKLNLPIYYPAENLPALFNVPGIPATFIFNETGQLIKRIEGEENFNTAQYKTLLQ